MQHVPGRARWDAGAVRDDVREYVLEPQPARARPGNWSSTTPTATGSTPTTVIRSWAAAPTRSSPPSTSGP
jgi:hypothetical protein